MFIEYATNPYKNMGDYIFGMSRNTIKERMGEPFSTSKYGYPILDRFLDDYGFLYVLSNPKGCLEAIEIYPEYTDDVVVLTYGDSRVEISSDIEQTMVHFRKISDDFTWNEDTYSSERLGVKVYCPDNHIENILIYDTHYYD